VTLTVIGTVALDTLAFVGKLARPETTGGIVRLMPDLFGGTGGNAAMALAKLGAPPRLLAAVGADFAGSSYERAMEAAGVGLAWLTRTKEPTSRAYVFVEEGGRAQMTYFYSGASRVLRPASGELGRAHFCAGEISLYPALMQRASWVSFDPGQEVHHRPLAEIEACLPHVDLLFLNKHEREALDIQADLPLDKLFALGVGTIVETRGDGGTFVHTAGGTHTHVPAASARVADPTGAGDSHRAGFLYALDRGADLASAARFASVMGAFAVEAIGAQAGLPTREAALDRYQKAYGRPFP